MSEQIEKAVWAGSTKKDLYDKYNALVDQYNSRELPSTEVAAKKREVETTIATANSIVKDMGNIEASVQKAIATLVSLSDQYQNINAAIAAKNGELKDILGFEVEANSTIALITAKDELVAEKEAEAKNVVANAKQEATEIISAANSESSRIKQEQDRQQAEWTYDFERSKKHQNDELTDQLNIRIKDVDERIRSVELREKDVTEREKGVDALELKITELEELKAGEIAEAVEAAKAEAKRSFDTSKSFSDRAHAQDLEMKDVKINALEEKVAELTKQLSEANGIISQANASVADMAKSALSAQADRETVAKLSEIVAQNSGNQKR